MIKINGKVTLFYFLNIALTHHRTLRHLVVLMNCDLWIYDAYQQQGLISIIDRRFRNNRMCRQFHYCSGTNLSAVILGTRMLKISLYLKAHVILRFNLNLLTDIDMAQI